MRTLIFIALFSFVLSASGQNLTKTEFKLIQAAENGNADSVLLLLNNKINVNCKTSDGMTPLHYAVQNGHIRVCRILVANGSQINPVDIDKRSPLLLAVHFSHLEIAEFLVQKGADPNIKDFEGLTPLFYAAAYGDYLLTDMFLFYNGKQMIKDYTGKTPFMTAIWGGYPRVASLLKKYGADINTVDKDGNSSLMLSIENLDSTSLDSLISWGADLELENAKGLTSLEIALAIKDPVSVNRLIQAGANVNHEIQPGIKTLDWATKVGAGDSIKKSLINAGAKPRTGLMLNQINLGMSTQFNGDDASLGLSVEWHDFKYQVGFLGGINQRPGRTQVNYMVNDTLSYLLNETRTTLMLGAYKEFALFHSSKRHHGGFKAYFSSGLSIGGFKASKKNPALRINVQPQICWYYNDTQIQYEIGYLYNIDWHAPTRPSMMTIKLILPLSPKVI